MKNKFTRVTAFTIIVVFIFVLITSRIIYLQIFNGEYYRSIAEAKAEREIVELAPRGEILDRNGLKIATNIQSYNITYSLSLEKKTNEELNRILIDTVNIICSNGDVSKLNLQSLPINYDASKDSFSFSFNSNDPEVIEKSANKYKTSKSINESLNARDTFYELAARYELVTKDDKGVYTQNYNITKDIMHRVVAIHLAIGGVAYKQYQVVYIANNVSKKTAFEIQYKNGELDGVASEVAPLRYYPNDESGSAFIGYLGKISSNIDEYTNMGYDASRELIGKDRLEELLENNRELDIKLRGEPGIKYVKVDKFGRVIDETAWRDPIPGDTVVTTIDMKLQNVAEKAFDKMMQDIRDGKYSSKEKYPNANRGALVVLDVNTGEILALVSRPGYNPNLFAETGGVKDPTVYNKLFLPDLKDPYDVVPRPMFNYAIQGSAPPGSTFKPFSAIAGLQEGKITPKTVMYDAGVYTEITGFAGKCWIYDERGITHGNVDVIKALQVSCNYFFYEVGRRLGADKIADWAWKFGIGRDPKTNAKPITGIEIPERAGSVGSPLGYKLINIKTKMRTIVEKLENANYGSYTLTEGTEDYKAIEQMMLDGQYDDSKLDGVGITNSKAKKFIKDQVRLFDRDSSKPGDALITAIGQGATVLTPLQMAQYIATLVNGGTRYKAHLIKRVLNADGTIKKEIQPEVLTKLDLNPEYIDAIKEGMKKVQEEGGTASRVFRNYPIETGGKTGTAQFSKYQAEVGRAAYGWFMSFAPYDKPEIVVIGVVYDGGHGNYVADAVKEVYDQYFKLNKEQPNAVQSDQTHQQQSNSTEIMQNQTQTTTVAP